MFLNRFKIIFDRVIDTQIKYLKSGTLEHHPNQILTNIMNIALHRTDNDFPNGLGTGLSQQRSKNSHTAFHCVRRHQHLRDEQNTVSKIDTHNTHTLYQSFSQHLIGRPTPLEQDIRTFFDLLLEPIVEIVVHLLNELFIRKTAQI